MTLIGRLADALERPQDKGWRPQKHQIPPDFESPDWEYWLLYGGRGIGKTDGGAYAFDRFMTEHPGSRGRIIAPTLGDAREACVVGPSGIKAHNPAVRWNVNDGTLTWPNGSRARIFGAYTPEDVERLRAGGNSSIDWLEEFAAWAKLDAAFNQARFGLRLGPHPKTIVTTTPRPRARMRWLLGLPVDPALNYGPSPKIVMSQAATKDNPHLAESVRASLLSTYEGTRIGRQELGGELLEDVDGALWNHDMLDQNRRPVAPELVRVVVGVDPAVTSGAAADETGIVVAGIGADGHGYVLSDRSCRMSPEGWARRAVVAYHEFSADRLIGEANNGGDMVELTIRTVDQNVAFRKVVASRGKRVRAEPVAALYEQGRVHHVGTHAALEDQMTTFLPEGGEGSPDRVDALVWALTDLMLSDPSSNALAFLRERAASLKESA